jgi:isocitrate dehydrogenase (NAD+)
VSADGETAFSGTRITRKGSERIVRYAFELAKSTGRKKVTAVHKANIIKSTSGLFLNVAREVAAQYPEIEFQEMIVDNCCMQLVMRPEQFDVIVTTNLFGDIISDLCAGLVGGLGLAPGANIGKDAAIFEAVHPRRTSPARARPIRARCWQPRRCWTMSASRKTPSACARPSWPPWKPRIR